jgi:hypothetical protein
MLRSIIILSTLTEESIMIRTTIKLQIVLSIVMITMYVMVRLVILKESNYFQWFPGIIRYLIYLLLLMTLMTIEYDLQFLYLDMDNHYHKY